MAQQALVRAGGRAVRSGTQLLLYVSSEYVGYCRAVA